MQTESNPRQAFREIARLGKEGRAEDALCRLTALVRQGGLDSESLDRAGKLIRELAPDDDAVRVALLGQCTTSWLTNSLTALAWGEGCRLRVHEGQYDNVAQELMALAASDPKPQVIILLPWSQRLLSDVPDRPMEQRIEDELAFWKQAWDIVLGTMGGRIVQVGYDWVGPGPLGYHLSARRGGYIDAVRRANDALRSALPKGSFFIDLEAISGAAGRERFYDLRRYFWTKQPFSELGVQRLAAHLWAGTRAVMIGPKKLLVLDLDNTLWGGVVGETGPLGISLSETPDGEAYRSFQKYAKHLAARGILLAVCSKNNQADALAPFQENPQMALSLSDFAEVEVSWDRKSAGLQRIAERLNLGLDSFVFFDDNPAEREEIRQALPQVEVIETPEDPADYISALESRLCFEAVDISGADLQRSEQYRLEKQRREHLDSLGSMEAYLGSLEMHGVIAPIDETSMDRVVQLIGKTNQFNLTTRRHSREEVKRLLQSDGSIGMVLTLADKFGDHGLVSVLLAVSDPAAGSPKSLRIDVWLMSCRVINRTAEQFVFNVLVDRARELGYETLIGEFIATKKNALVANLFDQLGFERVLTDGETVRYKLLLNSTAAAQTFVSARAAAGGAV